MINLEKYKEKFDIVLINENQDFELLKEIIKA